MSEPNLAEPDLAPLLRRSRWPALVPLYLVWLAAGVPVALWLVHRSDPELAVRMTQMGSTWIRHGLLGLAVLAFAALLCWPPMPAGLRLFLHRARLALTSDRRPLQRAIAELRHFESAQKHLEVGRLALQMGDLNLAAPHLQRALELDNALSDAHYQFGRLWFRLRSIEQAAAAFGIAEVLDPGHAFGDALLHHGRCMYLLGDTQGALALLRQHAERHGGNRRSHFWLGEALQSIGDREGSLASFRAAAAPKTASLTAEENWFRARARVALWRRGSRS
ncbi:MAG TPA: tetratricopeptide repeat protein [Planctomycetota bacterium]